MFRRRREKKALKEAAKAAKVAEEEAAKNIQLLRVAPRGTQYGGESPDFPLALRNVHLSRSMDALHEAHHSPQAAAVHPMMAVEPVPMVPAAGKKNKKLKKKGLRRVQSVAGDGLAQSPQERYDYRHHGMGAAVPDGGAVYYVNRPIYLIDERNGDAHPNSRPRYLVSAGPPPQNRSYDHPGYVASPGTPVLYHYRHPQQPQYLPSPTTPPEELNRSVGTPYVADGKTTVTRSAGRHRNYVQVIPRPENSRPAAAAQQQKRPVSQFYTSSPMRPVSTPLRTPSPMRSPSPAIYNTGPRKGKGKAIRVVEGWDEPDDEAPQIVQSHEVGVAPKSKVMDNFNSRSSAATGSAPFSITINEENPPASEVRLREPSRRNKARPISAAPWISSDSDFSNGSTGPITRQNGHMVVDFNE